VYIAESTASGTASTKFTAATIGVLNEEGGLNDELGMSSTNSGFWATDLNITDNSHYITKLFGLGPLPIVNSSQRMNVLAGTMATGLQNLAVSGSNSALEAVHSCGVAVQPLGVASSCLGRLVLILTSTP
jgi:hypothetical protein